MASFKLTKEADTFEFDTNGKVKKGSAAFGTWTINKSNQLVARGDAGNSVTFSDVVWKFPQGTNQLTLRTAADKEIFNFQKADVRPFYAVTPKAVLQVFPDEENDFFFELRGQWALDKNHDLNLTINGATSVIDGFVDDPKSRFTYFFLDKNKNDFNLVFRGQWLQPQVDDEGMKMTFEYETEEKDQAGKAKLAQFSLPGKVVIDRSINQFVYEYDKSLKKRRIKFTGLLNITPDFQITYSIDSQRLDDGSGVAVKATEFRLGAMLVNDKLSTELDLEFVLRNTSNGKVSKSVIGIKGHYTAKLGTANLELGFAFLQVRDGDVKTTTIAIGGKLVLSNNLTTLQWEFTSQNNVKSLTVSIENAQLGPVTASSKLIVAAGNGKQRAVTFLLGFNF